MNEPTPVCHSCKGQLAVTLVEGRESDFHCRSKECEMHGVNQRGLRPGMGIVHIGIGAKGITRYERGKPSQGEDNCEPVSKAILAWLGDEYRLGRPFPLEGAPRNSVTERGVDFSMRHSCGNEIEVQVTRLAERGHNHDLARANDEGVRDDRTYADLVCLLVKTIEGKSAIPPKDKARRILAIDGRSPGAGMSLVFTPKTLMGQLGEFGWSGVALVIDKDNTRFLDREGRAACPHCSESRSKGGV